MTESLVNYDLRPEDIEYNLQSVDISDPKIVDHRANRRRRSPIMVEFTDPHVTSVDVARTLEAGINIVKFRMAFSTKSQKVHMLSKIDKAAERCAVKKDVPICPVATCAALKTYVKKIGIFKHEPTDIVQGSEVILTCNKSLIENCTAKKIFLDYDYIADVNVGQEINLGHGKVVMHCIKKVDNNSIKCHVDKGGRIKSLETAFFRNHKNTCAFISKTDINILKFIAQYQVDILLVYCVKDGDMIKKIKHLISKAKIKPLIFSGICDQDGLDHLDDILLNSDGIVFCREFLPYELATHQVYRISLLQKWVAGKCQQVGKPMYITGVFDYVLKYGDICDSEVSDVTNALMDGVTGFILRDCHDINNTLYAIYGLNEICCQVEPLTFDRKTFFRMLTEPKVPVNASEAAVLSCVAAANQTNARIVVIPTVSGRTARTLLWLRPASIVITVCERMHAARMLYSFRNIVPIIYKGASNKKWEEIEEARVQFAAEFAVAKQWMTYGDIYVSLQRSYEGHLFCDIVRVWTVTFAKKMLVECHYDSDKEIVSDESVKEEKPKKRRRKKKKKVEIEEEQKIEEEEEKEKEDDKKSHLHLTVSIATPSQMARPSKSANEVEEEEDEENENEEEEGKN